MRRYGDNVSKEDDVEEEQPRKNVQFMYGGCGYGAGSFTRPQKTKKRFNLLRILGLNNRKAEGKS